MTRRLQPSEPGRGPRGSAAYNRRSWRGVIGREFKTRLRRVIKGTDYRFVQVKSIYYMIVKKRGGIASSWSPRVTQAERARAKVLVGAKC